MTWAKALVVLAALTVASGGIAVSDSVGATPGARGPDDSVVIRGRATLDGEPFDAPYLGAVVVRHGLVTPCQRTLPEVRAGRYRITVLARTEAVGCGTPGSKAFLWTFVQERIVFSRESIDWPGGGATARFRPTFSVSAPDGGVGPIAGFAGEVFDSRGRRQPPGARVEAFVAKTRCGVASIRRSGNFTGFSMNVVGPDSIPGCTLGAIITFRVNGVQTAETAINEPGDGVTLNLSPERPRA